MKDSNHCFYLLMELNITQESFIVNNIIINKLFIFYNLNNFGQHLKLFITIIMHFDLI